MSSRERMQKLVFEYAQRLFKTKIEEIKMTPIDESQLARANGALKFMAADLDGKLPDLPLPVLRLLYKKFSDFIITYSLPNIPVAPNSQARFG